MASRSSRSKAPAKGDLQVTPEEGRIENITPEATLKVEVASEEKSTEPVNLEVETPSDEPVPAPEAVAPSQIQTDVREKLSNRSVEKNTFVPSNPAQLEAAAAEVAKQGNFELNRGTSIGARLMARSQQRF